jgi:hypothetical protein
MEALMRIRNLPAFLVALLLLLAVACGGGSDEDSSSNQPAGNGGDELVLSAIEALGRSADDFQQDVDSMQGNLAMDMTMGDVSFGMQGEYGFQAPDQMFMTMEFTGASEEVISLGDLGEMEILVSGDQIYMNIGLFGGWVKASLDDLGLDADQFRELLSDQSPFDYAELVKGLGGDVQVQDLGPEDLDGRGVHHYRLSSDYVTLMEALGGAFGDGFSDSGFPVEDLAGPVVLDLWLGTEDLLPYKLAAKGAYVVDDIYAAGLGGNMAFNMTITIDEYNGAVSFPDPPADAIDISELGDEMFGGLPEGDE